MTIMEGFSFLSLHTGRTKVRFVIKGFDDVINDSDMSSLNIEDPKWKFGEAKLLSSGGKWFVHISVTAKLPVTGNEDISNIVGLDRGLVNIVTAADQSGFTARYSGDDARKIRTRYNKTRASLQKKGDTRSKTCIEEIIRQRERLYERCKSLSHQGTLRKLS